MRQIKEERNKFAVKPNIEAIHAAIHDDLTCTMQAKSPKKKDKQEIMKKRLKIGRKASSQSVSKTKSIR